MQVVNHTDENSNAAIILAGGEGIRLRDFAREIFGQDIPKQFCPLLDSETLLEKTMRRVSLLAPLSRSVTVVTRGHERFYAPVLAQVAPHNVFVQPQNRGTGPAILGALLSLLENGHQGAVGVFPSDHYISDDTLFARDLSDAFSVVAQAPDLIVLLGVKPDSAEPSYGWIEPGEPIFRGGPVFQRIARVHRFWEKPSPEIANRLFQSGSLWNSFIMVANAETFLALLAMTLPDLYATFAEQWREHREEPQSLERLYSRLAPIDFSGAVLQECADQLAVMAIEGVEWSDLGEPRRLLTTLERTGMSPQWLQSRQLWARREGRPV